MAARVSRSLTSPAGRFDLLGLCDDPACPDQHIRDIEGTRPLLRPPRSPSPAAGPSPPAGAPGGEHPAAPVPGGGNAGPGTRAEAGWWGDFMELSAEEARDEEAAGSDDEEGAAVAAAILRRMRSSLDGRYFGTAATAVELQREVLLRRSPCPCGPRSPLFAVTAAAAAAASRRSNSTPNGSLRGWPLPRSCLARPCTPPHPPPPLRPPPPAPMSRLSFPLNPKP